VTSTRAPATTTVTGPWSDRVDALDWDSVRGELDRYGCALTGPLLTAGEAAAIAGLYPDVARFRSTVDIPAIASVRASTGTSPNRSRTPSPP